MKKMHYKLVVALLFLFVTATIPAMAQGSRGEKSVGVEAGYADFNRSALAGVEFTYRFSRYVRIAPSVDYVFLNHGYDAMSINLNCQITFPLSQKVEIYPLAGLNFSGWNGRSTTNDGDVTTRTSRLGLNAGAGIGFRLSERMILGASAGYVVMKDFGGFEAMAKIAYLF